MESQVAEGLEVTGDFFESFILSFHGHQHVHLKDVLSAGQLNVLNRFLKAVQFLEGDAHQLGGVGARSFDLDSEDTAVREVGVDR